MAYSFLPEISGIALVCWISLGLVSIAFVASGDGDIGAGDGISLAWYIVLLGFGAASLCWIALLYSEAPHADVKTDCRYRAAALSMAIPIILVAALAVVGNISDRYGDQSILAILASFWMIPLFLWFSWFTHSVQNRQPYDDCAFSL
jgi:hypothetical protein